LRSAPQKHPNPKTAVCIESGHGATIELPRTKCEVFIV